MIRQFSPSFTYICIVSRRRTWGEAKQVLFRCWLSWNAGSSSPCSLLIARSSSEILCFEIRCLGKGNGCGNYVISASVLCDICWLLKLNNHGSFDSSLCAGKWLDKLWYLLLTITGSSCTVAITNEFVIIFIFCILIQAHFHRPTGKFPIVSRNGITACMLKRRKGKEVSRPTWHGNGAIQL